MHLLIAVCVTRGPTSTVDVLTPTDGTEQLLLCTWCNGDTELLTCIETWSYLLRNMSRTDLETAPLKD